MQKQVPLLKLKDFSFSPKDLQQNNEGNALKLGHDDRFVWNTHILQPFLNSTDNFGLIIPIINGSFCQKNLELEENFLSIVLISRRSRFNAGARYLKRGINNFADVANEVETEQVLFENNPFDNTLFKISSFLHVIFMFFCENQRKKFLSTGDPCLFSGVTKTYILRNPRS